MDDIPKKVLSYFSSKMDVSGLNEVEIDAYNYIDNKLFDSMEFVMLISSIETDFNISFSQEELGSDAFRTMGGLINIIQKKII